MYAKMLSFLRFRIALAELLAGTLALHVTGLCMNARLKIFCHRTGVRTCTTNLKICWHANGTTGSPSEVCRCSLRSQQIIFVHEPLSFDLELY